jgi:hypothetical protein
MSLSSPGRLSTVGHSKHKSGRTFANTFVFVNDVTGTMLARDLASGGWKSSRNTIHSAKLMLTIVWNSISFHLINVLPNGIKFNTSHYVTLLISLVCCQNGSKLKSVEAIENWSPMPITHGHIRRGWPWNLWSRTRWKEHLIHRAHLIWHLLNSISYLFGYIKQLFSGHEFPDREALLEAVRRIFEGIEKAILDRVFLAWMERHEGSIKTNGEYVE